MTAISFAGQFILFSLFFIWWSWSGSERWLKNSRSYHWSLLSAVLLLIVSAASLQFEVGDVKLFSGAGWWLRQGVDFYWIDADHGQYPFFPFLIFFYAGANWLTEHAPHLTFSFYLKLLEFGALGYLSYLIYQRYQKTWLSRCYFLV